MLFESFSAQYSGRFLDGFLKGRKAPLESSNFDQAVVRPGTFVGLGPWGAALYLKDIELQFTITRI